MPTKEAMRAFVDRLIDLTKSKKVTWAPVGPDCNEKLLGDSVYTKYGDGTIALLHFQNDDYAMAIQPLHSLAPEIFDFESDKDYQTKLYVIHQLAIRQACAVNEFIARFMAETAPGNDLLDLHDLMDNMLNNRIVQINNTPIFIAKQDDHDPLELHYNTKSV